MVAAIKSDTGTLRLEMNANSRSQYLALLILIGLWILTRGLLFLIYAPQVAEDTPTYQQLANQIVNLDFHDYNGIRTPGYPLLILLALNNYYMVWIVQSILSLLISILLFFIIQSHGVGIKWAFAGAALQLLALNQMFFEATVVTETLSTFLLVLVCYLFVRLAIGNKKWWTVLAIGLISASLILTRPQYIFIIPLFIFLMVFIFHFKSMPLIFIFLVLSSGPLIGWMYFNKEKTGHFSIATGLGYSLTNHSGAFMEYAPDEYALIRDIYLKHRALKIAEKGSHRMTIHIARKELREATGLSDADLSYQFQQLSMKLIVKFPYLYMASVADAWLSFWVVPNYWDLNNLKVPVLVDGLKAIWKGQQILYRLFNLLFCISAVVLLGQLIIRRRKNLQQTLVPMLLTTIILGNSVVQALIEYSENGRYSIPTQPLVVAAVILAMAELVNRRREQRRTG